MTPATEPTIYVPIVDPDGVPCSRQVRRASERKAAKMAVPAYPPQGPRAVQANRRMRRQVIRRVCGFPNLYDMNRPAHYEG